MGKTIKRETIDLNDFSNTQERMRYLLGLGRGDVLTLAVQGNEAADGLEHCLKVDKVRIIPSSSTSGTTGLL